MSILEKWKLKDNLSAIRHLLDRIEHISVRDLLLFYESCGDTITLIKRMTERVRTQYNKFESSLPSTIFFYMLEYLSYIEPIPVVCKRWYHIVWSPPGKVFV